MAFIKACNVSQTNHKLQEEIRTYQTKLDRASTNINGYSFLLNNYMQDFLNLYLNYPNNANDMDNRNKALSVYYATNLTATDQAGNDSQSFNNASIQSIYTRHGAKIAQYYVNYSINGNQTSGYLNIPFKVKNNKFTVVSYPYFSNKINPIGHIGKLQSKYSKDNQTTSISLYNQVTDFTKSFLKKYASAKTSDMKFIMANPQGLAGNYQVANIQNLHVYGTKNNPVVQCLLTLKRSDSDIEHSENVTLKLSKQQTTYFVDEFNHNIGGD
ncbi:conjugal transfer protein [Ligilactobacillus sp. WILCCON 0076]|uniref:Conjugal transfer protein n=1 Tax=Ligilactobacillus ubinensis TaxID=2876789 RepID=A0A9X2FKH1_9LACO|nr:conjugal transfer protein [Ligilactobacillus ubinensis]MCP0887344.1 conjugal transfer protein [Ligilactobacillus ubinensis]